jgi:hypothetical protein
MCFYSFASECALLRGYPTRQNHRAVLTEETSGLERRQEAHRGAGGTLKVTGVTPRVLKLAPGDPDRAAQDHSAHGA